MEVVNYSSTTNRRNPNNNDDSIYPVKTKQHVQRASVQTEGTARCSDFSDFSCSTEALGAIGFAYSSPGIDDSTRTRSTQLSYSGRYDYDVLTENEELRMELIAVRGQVHDLKMERKDLKSQIKFMEKEIARLNEELRVREHQLVWGAIYAGSKKKRSSFEGDSSLSNNKKRDSIEGSIASDKKRDSFEGSTSSSKRPSLVGRLFRRTSSRKLMSDEESVDQELPKRGLFRRTSSRKLMSDEDQELPNEVSIPSTTPSASEGLTPTKNPSRRSLFKRMFSGKGKDLQSSSSEIVSDDSVNNKPKEEEEDQRQEREVPVEKGGETIQYVDWQRDPLPDSFARVTMTGYTMNSILEEQGRASSSNELDFDMDSTAGEEKEEEYVQLLEWKREPLDAIVSAKKKKKTQEEYVQYLQWYREHPTTTAHVLNIRWERVPTTPVLKIRWERIPSSLNLVAATASQHNKEEGGEQVQVIDWYREQPAITPVLNITWERVPATPVLNIKWERIPSNRNLVAATKEEGERERVQVIDWYREQPATSPVLNITWERVPATPVLNIKWERIPSNRNLATATKEEGEGERVQVIDWYREQPATPVLNIKWERIPSTPVLNIKWERIPSTPVLNIKWERIPATPVLNITWERIPSTPVLNIQWERIPATPILKIRWQRNPSCRDLLAAAAAAEEERVHLQSPKSVLKSCLKSPDSGKKAFSFTAVVVSPQEEQATKRLMIRESINEVSEVTRIRGSSWDNCFFTEDELADFKYNAFLEECGLEDDDF